MSFRYIGAIISATPPTVTPPSGGEGGSASGAWSLGTVIGYEAPSGWPRPLILKYLWSWGRGVYGVLGLGNTTNYSSPKQVGALTTWLKIASGFYHTISVKTDGTLWAWGWNAQGQLGLGNTSNCSDPTQVGALTTWSAIAGGRHYTIALG